MRKDRKNKDHNNINRTMAKSVNTDTLDNPCDNCVKRYSCFVSCPERTTYDMQQAAYLNEMRQSNG